MSAMDTTMVDDRETGLRRCIVTGARLPRERLLRFVVGPDGQVVPDLENRLPGRGLWLSATRDVVNTAGKKGSFSKAARRAVTCPDDLADRVEGLLAGRCLDLVGLARRAGQAVAGFEKVAAQLRKGQTGLLIMAADAGRGDVGKIRALGTGVPVIDVFDAHAMGAAWGRDRQVYIAIAPGRLAQRLAAHAERLAEFRRVRDADSAMDDKGSDRE